MKFVRAEKRCKCIISYNSSDTKADLVLDVLKACAILKRCLNLISGQDSCVWMRARSHGKRCVQGYQKASVASVAELLRLPPSASGKFCKRERYKGGTLIVTFKKDLDQWECALRAIPCANFLSYTDTLGRRRKLGAYRAASYDFVLTTFDVRTEGSHAEL